VRPIAFDLVLRAARIAGREDNVVDIGIADGRIVAIKLTLPAAGTEETIGPCKPPHRMARRGRCPHLVAADR
jgi:N-acyl-D-aspartate/D-glutamate deacylase